jgi:hypothetical protein
MINVHNLLNIINNNKEKHNLYILDVTNNKIYGYIKNIELNNNIIKFNYIDYFTEFEYIYEIKNNINTNCTIIEPDKIRGIFRGIIKIT